MSGRTHLSKYKQIKNCTIYVPYEQFEQMINEVSDRLIDRIEAMESKLYQLENKLKYMNWNRV